MKKQDDFIKDHRQPLPIDYKLMGRGVAILCAFYIFEEGCAQWYKFVSTNLTSALLVGIGIVYINLPELVSAFTAQYVILVVVTVIGLLIGAGFIGKLLGFYPAEAAITGGICMANMGGTGDVAVLSAAKRMELMLFAQISSRLGGAFMILLAATILKIYSFIIKQD